MLPEHSDMTPSSPSPSMAEGASSSASQDYYYPDYPSFEEEGPAAATAAPEDVGGCVWVVLFGLVMGLAVCANLALGAALVAARRTRRDPCGALLMALFAIGVLDYSALSFQFSLGVEQRFPYGRAACAAYQAVTRSTPVTQSAALLLMVWHGARGTGEVGLFSGVLSPLAVVFAVSALPTLLLSDVMIGDNGSQFCDVALEGSASTVYQLTFSAVLTYWLPLMVSLPFLLPMLRTPNPSSEEPFALSYGRKVTTSTRTSRSRWPRWPTLPTAAKCALASFFCFYLPHAIVVTARHVMDLAEVANSPRQEWTVKVIQSLFWLLAYFWHFARPALVILLDGDLKDALAGACSFLAGPTADMEDDDYTHSRIQHNLSLVLTPGDLERRAPLLVKDPEAAAPATT